MPINRSQRMSNIYASLNDIKLDDNNCQNIAINENTSDGINLQFYDVLPNNTVSTNHKIINQLFCAYIEAELNNISNYKQAKDIKIKILQCL